MPCPGLADAVEYADEEGIEKALAAAAALTPPDVQAVVLGCTHYELVAERIRSAVQLPGRPPLVLYGSAGAVAAQALRRIGAEAALSAEPSTGVTVLLGGHLSELPEAALAYQEGRGLAAVGSAR